MMDTKLEYTWPEVFDTKALGGRCDAALCANGLAAWGNCMAGATPHPNFGEVIAEIALKLDILGTPKSFMEKAKEYDGSRPNWLIRATNYIWKIIIQVWVVR